MQRVSVPRRRQLISSNACQARGARFVVAKVVRERDLGPKNHRYPGNFDNMTKTKRTAIKTIVSISIGLACLVLQRDAQASTTIVPFTDLVLDGSPPANIHCKALGDINNDGRLDVVVASSAGDGMYWYENPGGDGSATSTKHTIFASGSWTTDMQVADVDGDGWPDIITAKDTDG